jgi:hypothetical protein
MEKLLEDIKENKYFLLTVLVSLIAILFVIGVINYSKQYIKEHSKTITIIKTDNPCQNLSYYNTHKEDFVYIVVNKSKTCLNYRVYQQCFNTDQVYIQGDTICVPSEKEAIISPLIKIEKKN